MSFLDMVRAEVERARSLHGPMNSLHEAYAVILEEVDELWDQCRLRTSERDPKAILDELVHIAAMACRTALDLGYEDPKGGSS